jgi:hypothetical protein
MQPGTFGEVMELTAKAGSKQFYFAQRPNC